MPCKSHLPAHPVGREKVSESVCKRESECVCVCVCVYERERGRAMCRRGGYQKSICLTQLTSRPNFSRPNVVQIWSRNPRISCKPHLSAPPVEYTPVIESQLASRNQRKCQMWHIPLEYPANRTSLHATNPHAKIEFMVFRPRCLSNL